VKSPELWFTEYQTRGLALSFRVKRTLEHFKSKFQDILVLETEEFGRMLVLDGCVMTTERDEFIYHEMLVHPSMMLHPSPRHVLIIGGGDGGALREVLRYKEVEKSIMVELDEEVVRISKQYLPSIASAFDDPRADVLFYDGAKFVRECKDGSFDIVIVDSTDPVGSAEVLFSKEFYSEIKRILRPNGIVVTQSESPFLHFEFLKKFHSMLRSIFLKVKLYTASVPTYPSGFWSFTIATDSPLSKTPFRKEPDGLKFFNSKMLNHIFVLPNFLKDFE